MAVSFARMVLYLFGIVLVIGAIGLFFFQSGLSRWIPTSMLVAGILLVIGLAVMGFADSAPETTRERVVDRRDVRDDDVTIIRK